MGVCTVDLHLFTVTQDKHEVLSTVLEGQLNVLRKSRSSLNTPVFMQSSGPQFKRPLISSTRRSNDVGITNLEMERRHSFVLALTSMRGSSA